MPRRFTLPLTKKSLAYAAGLSVFPLIGALALAALAWRRIDDLSLPLPLILPLLSTLHPIFSTPAFAQILSTLLRRRRRGAHRDQGATSLFNKTSLTILLILVLYSGILLTLLAVHASPAFPLTCQLSGKWQFFWRTRDLRIEHIQDELNCCGFRTVRDMAFPFHNSTGKYDPKLCVTRYNRDQACLVPLTNETRAVLGRLIVSVVVAVLGGLGVSCFVFLREERVNAGMNARTIRYGSVENGTNGSGRIASSGEENRGRIEDVREDEPDESTGLLGDRSTEDNVWRSQ